MIPLWLQFEKRSFIPTYFLTDFSVTQFQCGSQAVVKLEVCYLGVVGRLLDNFGSHPERCAHKRFPLDLRVRQLTSHAKVSQLHLTVFRQQHVGS